MTALNGPLIDVTNFPASEEWKEGGADLEDQLLCGYDGGCEMKKVQAKGYHHPWRRLRQCVGWSSVIGLCLPCCVVLCVLLLYFGGGSEESLPAVVKLTNGLYQWGSIISFSSAPHLLPQKISDWSDSDYQREYMTFKRMYRRSRELLSAEEESERFKWFKMNLRYIHEHNADDLKTFTMAPNQFTDMSFNEWSRKFTSTLPIESKRSRQTLWHLPLVSNSSLPASVNWHDKGCVTPIKDQAQCGSCWAFSSTGAIEGAVCAQTGRLVSLSEQQLIDCSSAEGTHGCNGGFMDNAFQYVMDVGGICSEDEYPYHAKQEVCKKSCRNVAKISGIMDVPPGDVKALKAAIALHGPVAAGVQADRPAFQFYHKGVLNVECGKHLNHAILVTGYGVDSESGLNYWLVKNSWGATWGDEGYIKLAMKHHGKAGECGILLAPSVPIVKAEDIHL